MNWDHEIEKAARMMAEAKIRAEGGKVRRAKSPIGVDDYSVQRSEHAKPDQQVRYNPEAFRVVRRSEAKQKKNREPVKAYEFSVPKTPQLGKDRWAVKCPVAGCDWEDQWFPSRRAALKSGNGHVVACHAVPRSK